MVLTNDDRSRTFIAVRCESRGAVQTEALIRNAVDPACESMQQPTYYATPILHVSVAWALGNVSALLPLPALRERLGAEVPETLSFWVDGFECQAGNRRLEFALRP